MSSWLVVCASPRQGGNSEQAARLICQGLDGAGATAELVRLGDLTIAPCMACGLCSRRHDLCSLDPVLTGRKDDAAALFARMHRADGLVLAVPVYFYGLPAQCKALVDRSQRFWAASGACAGQRVQIRKKPGYAVFPAARVGGERLFEGSLLTLRLFYAVMGFELKDFLPLRGLENMNDLAGQSELCSRVRAWGMALAASADGTARG